MTKQMPFQKLFFILCILFLTVSSWAQSDLGPEPMAENRTALSNQNEKQIINEDLYVDGNQCLGTQCTGSETFGYDTLRLKQDNLRVMFQDTSGALPDFPKNDWQIRINESTQYGQSAFFIDDLGPDATGSANDVVESTPFTIEAGSPDHTLYLNDNGRVGIGTATPLKELHISSNLPEIMLYDETESLYGILQYNNGEIAFEGNSEQDILRVHATAPADSFVIDSTGDLTLGGNLELASSRQLKKNIRPLNAAEAVEALNALNPVKFCYKQNQDEESIGFIAEEVPDLAATNGRKSVNPMDLVAILTKVVQKQQQINETLTRRIAHLEKQAFLKNKDL